MTISPAARALAALAGLCLLVAGCSNTSGAYNARFTAPVDIVAFTGVTKKNTGLHDYLAIASARGGDLVFVDPADDRAVLSPGAVFPISVVTDPRPLRLAAASLGDRGAGGADLLIAVSSGSLELQVVETWTASNRIVPGASVPLAALVGEGEILSVAAFTPPTATATAPRARVLAGISGGRLVVVDFTRDATTGGVIAGAPVLKSIGVDAVAIGLEPGGTRAFLATTDPLPGSGTTPLFGVAWLDAGADPAQAWAVGALDARGPTRALAVAMVQERLVDPANTAAPDTFDPVARLRIYAIYDQSGCGNDRMVGCGVAMLDDHGLLPDPAGELPYRAPLPVNGVATGIAVMYPPAHGNARLEGDDLNPGLPLMIVQPSNKHTTAVAAVTSSDGSVYLYDLGRFSPVNTGSALSLGIGVNSAASYQPADAVVVGSPNYGKPMYLGFWNDFPVPVSGASVVVDPSSMRSYMQVTPGMTPSDTFSITWQGELPGLATRRGVIGRAASGETFVAVQANAGTTTQPSWVATVTLADPALGVHGGDLVVVTPDDVSLCATGDANQPYPELTIATDTPFLAPDPARFPGGAVKVAAGTCFDQRLAAGQTVTATLTIRAAGLVLSSGQLGYLGRPVLDQTFVLSHQDEAQVTGEALAIARKTRRKFYPTEASCTALAAPPGCFPLPKLVNPNFDLIWNPLAAGPLLGFRVGLYSIDPATTPTLALLPRGSRIIAQTLTGPSVTGYRPSTGGVLPGQVIAYDPTRVPLSGHENDGGHFYAAFRDDQVMDVTPGALGGSVRSIR